jgi:hypothetical protein
MITASLRATAIWARILPRRLSTSRPQRLTQLQRLTRVSSTFAAADSDEAGRGFRFEAGHDSDLKAAAVPI